MSENHPPCSPITKEFGNPPDFGLMEQCLDVTQEIAENLSDSTHPGYDPAVPAVNSSVSIDSAENDILGEHSNSDEAGPEDESQQRLLEQRVIELGQGADAAIKEVGCGACVLSGICPVKKILHDLSDNKTNLLDRREIAKQIDASPTWLKIYRRAQAKLSIDNGNKPKGDELLAGIENQPLAPLKRGEAQELNSIPVSVLDEDVEIPGQRILSTATGNEVDVYDARDSISLNGSETIPDGDLSILVDKFVKKIISSDENGDPSILTPDGNIQKILKGGQDGVGRFYEIRMGGKSRLYFSVLKDTNKDTVEKAPPRIIIVGQNGDNAQKQTKVLDTLLAS